MKRKLLCAATAAVLSLTNLLPAMAADIGEPIGDIYTTDILAYVEEAPIRSYALNGKTAILVEDLARYGFVVGYEDNSRSLYAFVKTNTYPHEPDSGIERGIVGSVAGKIYASDIRTTINGMEVPSFTLNGVTAVAIEDIAADETQNETKKTCMTYRWDAENRTITLNPVYDNTDKIAGGFFGIIDETLPQPEISENGVLTFQPNTNMSFGKHITANLPIDAYNYPIRWLSETGPVVAKAYASAVTAPDQNDTGIHALKSYTRYIIDWDFDAVQSALAETKFETNAFDSIVKTETERLTNDSAALQTYENNDYFLLTNGNEVVCINKQSPFTVWNIACEIVHDGYVNQIVIEKPDTSSLHVEQVLENPDNTFTLLCTLNGETRIVRVGGDPFVSVQHVATVSMNTGTIYPMMTVRNVPTRQQTLFIDGVSIGTTDVILDGMYSICVPIDTLSAAIGGTVSYNNLGVQMTTDGSNHTYRFEVAPTAEADFKPTQELSSLYYTPQFTLNGTPSPLTITVWVGHWENTHQKDIELPLLYQDGKVYVPINALSCFTAAE